MRIDISFLPALALAFILIFARIGVMVMLLPAIGESAMPARMRLTLALLLSAILLPLHRTEYAVDTSSYGAMLTMLGKGMLGGATLGITVRLTLSALQVAGTVVAQQLGLGFVTAVDPTQGGQQNVIVGNFLAVLAVTMIFATDMHHLVIAALNDSYRLFRPGDVPIPGDIADLVTRTVASAFRIGIQLSAPFLVFGLLFNLGLGILSRLMPQMQVFFVALPVSILVGLMLLVLVVSAMMGSYLDYLGSVLGELTR